MSADDLKHPDEVTDREIPLPVEDLQPQPVESAKAEEVKGGGGDLTISKQTDASTGKLL